MWRAMAIGLGAAGFAAAGVTAERLNELLAERREANVQYAADNVAWALEDGGPFAQQLMEHERAMGRAWDDLIRYAAEHEDVELKRIVLRLEYHDELRAYSGMLNEAEDDAERRELLDEARPFAAALREVEPGYLGLNPEESAAEKPAAGRRGGAAPY